MIFLHDLPPDHPDRNRPLLGCNYKLNTSMRWKQVSDSYGVAHVTYNDLRPESWTVQTRWTWDTPDETV